ncbi:hypothetical protein [Aurantivibrio plasticivorans]
MQDSPLFSAPVPRVVACVFGVFVTTIFVTAGATVYIPTNEIDRIGVPALLFPVVWLLLLVASVLIKKIWAVWGLLGGISAVHAFIIFSYLVGG